MWAKAQMGISSSYVKAQVLSKLLKSRYTNATHFFFRIGSQESLQQSKHHYKISDIFLREGERKILLIHFGDFKRNTFQYLGGEDSSTLLVWNLRVQLVFFKYKLKSQTRLLRSPFVLLNVAQMRNSFLGVSDRSQPCPLLAVRYLHQNRSCHRQKSDFPDAVVQTALHCVGQASLQTENLNISLCVWVWRWSLLCLLHKRNKRLSALLFFFFPNRWISERHLTRTISPSCEKPHSHTLHNKYEGPNG